MERAVYFKYVEETLVEIEQECAEFALTVKANRRFSFDRKEWGVSSWTGAEIAALFSLILPLFARSDFGLPGPGHFIIKCFLKWMLLLAVDSRRVFRTLIFEIYFVHIKLHYYDFLFERIDNKINDTKYRFCLIVNQPFRGILALLTETATLIVQLRRYSTVRAFFF